MTTKWENLAFGPYAGRRFYLLEHMSSDDNDWAAHSLSAHRDCKGKWWLMDDPSGEVPFRKKRALAGPLPTEDAVKVAYLIRVGALG